MKQRSRRPKIKDPQVPQSSVPSDNVADEAVYKELDDNLVRAATIASSLKAEHDSASLGDQEDASKQGRKIDDIDNDAEITLVDETQGRYGDDLMFDTDVLDDKEVFTGQDMAKKEINVAEKEVSTADPVTTVGEVVTTASVEISAAKPTETTITDDLTIARTLIEIRSAKPKVKWVVIVEQSESTTRIRPQQLLSKDKAMIDVDYKMAQKMQAEEQEKFSIEEKSKLFAQLLEARKKHFAAMRSQEKRNKPPTKAQKRKTMSTYLKNMAGHKHCWELNTSELVLPNQQLVLLEENRVKDLFKWDLQYPAVIATQGMNKEMDLSIVMMTLPSEHLLTFNKHTDAKSLFEAIEARFGGNEATKETQKTLLKQMYETVQGSSIRVTSLPTEWGMHVVVWRNKSDLGSISFDDLYNNFKIVEPEVKRSVISSSNSGSQNLAFLSGHSSTNDVNTANVHVSTGSTPVSTASTNNSTACLSDATVYAYLATQPNGSQVVHEDLEQIHEDDLDEMDLKWQLALLSMKARKFYQRTGKKIIINGSDTAGYDKKKVECFNCHKLGHFARECRKPRSQENRNRSQDSSRRTVNVEESYSKAMLAIDGTGFDWSYMADEEASTNFALMAYTS
ncbi:putative ribonuclease H-like domain-containing protein [Tanacetum coccineum]